VDSKGRNKQSVKAQMNTEKKKQLRTKAAEKQRACSFNCTLSTREHRFTQRRCGVVEGNEGEVRDSENDHYLSNDEEDAKRISLPVCLRRSVGARTGFRAACVSYEDTRSTPVSKDNFFIPHLGEQKENAFFISMLKL
jgi:hypothetical protein